MTGTRYHPHVKPARVAVGHSVWPARCWGCQRRRRHTKNNRTRAGEARVAADQWTTGKTPKIMPAVPNPVLRGAICGSVTPRALGRPRRNTGQLYCSQWQAMRIRRLLSSSLSRTGTELEGCIWGVERPYHRIAPVCVSCPHCALGLPPCVL